eukprot:2889017-Rhodomonas_salina.2
MLKGHLRGKNEDPQGMRRKIMLMGGRRSIVSVENVGDIGDRKRGAGAYTWWKTTRSLQCTGRGGE